MTAPRIAIVGAGMAGLACARALADAGLQPTVFDKGRGIGGRLATRRAPGGLQFDHGAQYVTAKDAGFAALLDAMQHAGVAAPWADGSGRTRLVGVPGMSALAKHLGQGLDIRQNAELFALQPDPDSGGWLLRIGAEDYRFDQVVLTPPAPQTLRLLGAAHEFAAPLSAVTLAPCLTLMAAFAADMQPPFVSRGNENDPLAWIALDSTKPGRDGAFCWVAQASPEWSMAHLERDMAELAALMLPLLCAQLGADPAQVRHSAAHRWRYAKVTAPLGAPFLRDKTGTLHAGGDWCLGARVEAAWTSGDAIAREIMQGL
jgi:renalase